jgi:hypothetical protein
MAGASDQQHIRAAAEGDTAEELEREVDQTIALCDGDAKAAVRTLLIANAFLHDELRRSVSAGFTRGRTPERRASDQLELWREISTGKSKGQ